MNRRTPRLRLLAGLFDQLVDAGLQLVEVDLVGSQPGGQRGEGGLGEQVRQPRQLVTPARGRGAADADGEVAEPES